MRFLFSFAGGNGHFQPLIPLARAAQAAGHTVAFAGQPVMLPAIQAAGFEAVPIAGSTLSAAPRRLPLLPLDPAREDSDLRNGFALRLARLHAAEIQTLAAAWQPDLIVCDEVDFGVMIAAEKMGIPYASVQVIASGAFIRREVVGEALNTVRTEHDLPPDPVLEMLWRYLVLSPFPPAFRHPDHPLPPTAHAYHPQPPPEPPSAAIPPGSGPLVYFTLGTIFNTESGDLFERVLAALGEMPLRVLATTGRELTPALFGPQPAHIHVEPYIPQEQVLPYCAAVISHGGSGSVAGALAHGLPMLLLPMGADQPLNAARCEALGVGRVLDPSAGSPAQIASGITAVLNDPACRRAAARLQAEFAALPGPASALELLERLAASKRPYTPNPYEPKLPRRHPPVLG